MNSWGTAGNDHIGVIYFRVWIVGESVGESHVRAAAGVEPVFVFFRVPKKRAGGHFTDAVRYHLNSTAY